MSLVLYDFATPFKDYTGDYAYENPALYKEYIRKLSKHKDYKWLPPLYTILIGVYDTMNEEWYDAGYLVDSTDEQEYESMIIYFDYGEWNKQQKINAEEILCSTEGSDLVGAI